MSAIEDEIVIGEGVAISVAEAPITMRMLSGLIDVIVYLVGYFVTMQFLEAVVGQLDVAAASAVYIGVLVVWVVLVPAVVEVLTRGRSLGKLALGIRIVRDDGGPVGFRHALGRSLVGLLEIYASFGTVAATTAVMSSRGKRMGDIVVGTYPMRTRGAKSKLPPLVVHPALEEWSRTADILRLPDGLALTARTFVGRAGSLTPQSRDRLGRDIASRVAEYVSPSPPEGTHPEYFLQAVLAARRDREYALLTASSKRYDAEMERVGALPFGIEDPER